MPRDIHMKERVIRERDFAYPNGEWRNKDGRPNKQNQVLEWRAANPDGTKYRCIKETGLDKKTVYKWWDSVSVSVSFKVEKAPSRLRFLADEDLDLEEPDNIFEFSAEKHNEVKE